MRFKIAVKDKNKVIVLHHDIVQINCVVPENIHTPPTEGIGNSEEGGS